MRFFFTAVIFVCTTAGQPELVSGTKPNLERVVAAAYIDAGLVTSHAVSFGGASIKYLQAGSLDSTKTLIFCHGAAYSAHTWQLVGALDAAAAQGMAALAIDLPGYNGSGHPSSVPRDAFVRTFAEAIGVRGSVLVVSASMGGTYALPFVLSPGPFTIAGYVTIAGSISALSGGGVRSGVPALVIFGDQDARLATDRAPYEHAFERSQVVVFEHAPHPCYLRDVAAAQYFTDLLVEFAGGTAVQTQYALTQRAAWGSEL